MSAPKYVFVTAAEGREVPVPPNEASAPGATMLRCLPGKVYRLPWTTYTRRRITSGDLILCSRNGVHAPDAEKADASDAALPLDDTGAVAAEHDALPLPPLTMQGDTEATVTLGKPRKPFDTSDTNPRKG